MTTSVTTSCFTAEHQHLQDQDQDRFLVIYRFCPKIDGLRLHHWLKRQKTVRIGKQKPKILQNKTGYFLDMILLVNCHWFPPPCCHSQVLYYVLSASSEEYGGPTKYHLCVFGEIVPVFDALAAAVHWMFAVHGGSVLPLNMIEHFLISSVHITNCRLCVRVQPHTVFQRKDMWLDEDRGLLFVWTLGLENFAVYRVMDVE